MPFCPVQISKPHLFKFDGWWYCGIDASRVGVGSSPKTAYGSWSAYRINPAELLPARVH